MESAGVEAGEKMLGVSGDAIELANAAFASDMQTAVKPAFARNLGLQYRFIHPNSKPWQGKGVVRLHASLTVVLSRDFGTFAMFT